MELIGVFIALEIIIIGFLCTFIAFVYLKNRDIQNKRRLDFIMSTSSYITTLEHFMGKAYDIIYKEFIFIFSLEATGLPSKEYEHAVRSFIELTIKMIGPAITKELIDYFGNEATLYFNISEYFTVRYEQDEIRKSATETLMTENETT